MKRLGPILGLFVALAALGIGLVACEDPHEGELIEVDLTAEVVDWEVVDGETVEVWGYNGEYPGPMIEARVGDTLRVNLTNNLPEGTTIHWHGIEVPNEQDGVPGITQPIIEPGEQYTYEFELEKSGTTMYHTHANTVKQLSRGLVGPLVVRERGRAGDTYDREYTMVLHEIGGLFTINGHSFPATLADDDTNLQIATGESLRVRFINAGQQHHPMHLHGHQFEVISVDGNDLDNPYFANTVDVAPGATVDVEVLGNNPGTWTFHCHILNHVTNRGVYPGGMLTLLDYTDHTSYGEEQAAAAPADDADSEATPEPTPTPEPAAAADGESAEVEVLATEFAFDPGQLTFDPGTEVTISLKNDGAILHNLEITELGVFVQAEAGETAEVTFTAPDSGGPFTFICNIPGHREGGMEGAFFVRRE